LTYIKGDNDLAEFAIKDINEMILGFKFAKINPNFAVNCLVQWDQPNNKKTWRYRVNEFGKIEDDSLSSEMGINPSKELVDCAKWVAAKYPANKYAIILWNHGSGVEDSRSLNNNLQNSFDQYWMDIFKSIDLAKKEKKSNLKSKINNGGLGCIIEPGRGIVYDDSEHTCLTNQGLSNALMQICEIFGKKIDILGMDACLMAMVEIAYQVKDFVNVLIGSQETEPGYGWDYSRFLPGIVSRPDQFDAFNFSELIVKSYADFYSGTGMQDYTLSAIDLSRIDALRLNLDCISLVLLECLKYKYSDIKNAVRNAKSRAKSFQNSSYIDLLSFYNELSIEVIKLIQDAENNTPSCFGFFKPSPKYLPALESLIEHLNDGIALIPKIIVSNTFGKFCNGSNGISIYFPKSTMSIHPSYHNTLFAQQSQWLSLIKKV